MKLPEAIDIVSDTLIGNNNRTPAEDAAVVLYQALREKDRQADRKQAEEWMKLGEADGLLKAADTLRKMVQDTGVKIVECKMMPEDGMMVVSAEYTPERFARYERALKEINLGRHGKLDSTQMALVAWVALRDGK